LQLGKQGLGLVLVGARRRVFSHGKHN